MACTTVLSPFSFFDRCSAVISDTLSPVPWKYVNERELQSILSERIKEGFMFPLNPKWILCDPGWKKLYDELLASNALYADLSKDVWFPPHSGLRKRIAEIHARHPRGFQKRATSIGGYECDQRMHASLNNRDLLSGQAAAELAELELEHYDGYDSTSDDDRENMDGIIIGNGRRGRRRGGRKRRSKSIDGESSLRGLHGAFSNRAFTVEVPGNRTPRNRKGRKRWIHLFRFRRHRKTEGAIAEETGSRGSWLSRMFGGRRREQERGSRLLKRN